MDKLLKNMIKLGVFAASMGRDKFIDEVSGIIQERVDNDKNGNYENLRELMNEFLGELKSKSEDRNVNE